MVPKCPTVGSMSEIVSLPDGPAGGDGLTVRQRKILEYITQTTADRGYPPSVREIGDAVGLSSSSSVQHQLGQLVTKGFINRDATRARAIDLRSPEPDIDTPTVASTLVPLVGQIAAGGPILAQEAVEEVFPLPASLVGTGTLFMLKVKGDSMVDAAICDGDWVVVMDCDLQHRPEEIPRLYAKAQEEAAAQARLARDAPPHRQRRARAHHATHAPHHARRASTRQPRAIADYALAP